MDVSSGDRRRVCLQVAAIAGMLCCFEAHQAATAEDRPKIRMDVPVHLSFAETVKKIREGEYCRQQQGPPGRHNSTAIRRCRETTSGAALRPHAALQLNEPTGLCLAFAHIWFSAH